MKRVITISLWLLSLSLFFVLSPSITNAQPVDFSVTYIDPNWESEVFHTLSFATAAITFDSEDNLYASDINSDWGPGIKSIIRLEAPEYNESSIYLSFDTAYWGINGMDFDCIGNLYVSEFMGRNSDSDAGAIRKINTRRHKVSEPIEFLKIPGHGDFRPTGITATGFGTIYFPGRKYSDLDWGNIYKIKSFRRYDPFTGLAVYQEGDARTAIAIDKWGNLYVGSRGPDNSIYTVNPYTGEFVKIASFNQYVEELAFDSNGNLHALEGTEDDPSTIIKLVPPYISIDGCNTRIIDWPLPDGSTISEMIENCEDTAADHGQFVRCVVHGIIDLMRDGIISKKKIVPVLLCAAKANIP